MHTALPSRTGDEAAPGKRRKAAAGPARHGPGRPTRQQIEDRNAELLDHVMDLLLREGFDAVTIRGVTEAIGMAKRTVVARYGNKASLCKAALERAIDAWAVPVDRLRAAETGDLETTLLHVARLLVASYMSPEGLKIAQVTNAEAYRMPEISSYSYERCTRPLIAYLADLFRRFRGPGADFPDAEDYALSFLSLAGTPARMAGWGIRLDAEEIEQRTAHSVRLFLLGLPR